MMRTMTFPAIIGSESPSSILEKTLNLFHSAAILS